MSKHHIKRRKRRRANAVVKWGESAVRAHRKFGGRTGSLRAKRTPVKEYTYKVCRPNPPGPMGLNLGKYVDLAYSVNAHGS